MAVMWKWVLPTVMTVFIEVATQLGFGVQDDLDIHWDHEILPASTCCR